MSVASDADANNLETQRRVLADCEQVFEDVGSGASWNRPGLNRLKAALQQGDCLKVAALDRLGRSLTEVPGPTGLGIIRRSAGVPLNYGLILSNRWGPPQPS